MLPPPWPYEVSPTPEIAVLANGGREGSSTDRIDTTIDIPADNQGDETMSGNANGTPTVDDTYNYWPSDLDLDSEDLESDHEETEIRRKRNRWLRNLKGEVKTAFTKLPDCTGKADPKKKEVEVVHKLSLSAQVRIVNTRRRLEERGVVFCTIDISPSRDAFCTWLQQEVVEKTVVQIKHVRILAARHYLVTLYNIHDRDTVLAGGPYYLRRRMVYTTPWEPGFDTSKVLAKNMACWLDLVDVDPLLEGESLNLLQTLGDVIQSAGTTERFESKFANVRGCVLMDMTQPLPTILTMMILERTQWLHRREADQTTDKGSTSKTSGTGGEMDDPAASAHTPQELNRPQNGAQADPAEEVAARALSLDESHQVRDHIIEQNRLEKEKKKERKKEKKRAARKKRAERTDLNLQEEDRTHLIELSDEAESDDSRTSNNRLWQTKGEKKSKGQAETMDAKTARVEVRKDQQVETD
ncbi:hypothetical protein R1sor_024706 [Riccia sorocarpa]|uniref:DUF4283 domain-containing protein n=1 Tax=Riccia sorocarpa TaxID=122646 RepID=A0ABD3GR87_9MARC